MQGVKLLPLGARALQLGGLGLTLTAVEGGAGVAAAGTPACAAWCSRPFSTVSEALDRAPPAFVFDIDGVLIQGRHTLPQAKR